MNKLIIAAALFAAAGAASAATVSAAEISQLKALTAQRYSQCRDNANAKEACEKSQQGFAVLEKLNICWNARSSTPAEAWVPCVEPQPVYVPAPHPCAGIADSRNRAQCDAWYAREETAKAWQRWAR